MVNTLTFLYGFAKHIKITKSSFCFPTEQLVNCYSHDKAVYVTHNVTCVVDVKFLS